MPLYQRGIPPLFLLIINFHLFLTRCKKSKEKPCGTLKTFYKKNPKETYTGKGFVLVMKSTTRALAKVWFPPIPILPAHLPPPPPVYLSPSHHHLATYLCKPLTHSQRFPFLLAPPSPIPPPQYTLHHNHFAPSYTHRGGEVTFILRLYLP